MNEVDYSPKRYNGNGATKEFPFDWKAFEAKDLIIKLVDSEGNEEILSLGVDYTVQVEAIGGNVILKNAPETGKIIVIARDVSDYQGVGYSTSTGFQGSEIEKSFDRVSCNLQEMNYNIENFKTNFSAETNDKIDENKADTDKQIEDNKTDTDGQIDELTTLVNNKIANNKADTDKQIADFKAEVNSTIAQVNEAAQKLSRLDEAVETCETKATEMTAELTQAKSDIANTISDMETSITDSMAKIDEKVQTATNQAEIATEQAEIATAKAEECIATLNNKANIGLDNLNQAGEKRFSDIWKIISCVYYGEDLTEKFADEIAEYSSAWDWIKARIQAGQFEGIRPFDYIPMVMQSGVCGGYTIPEKQFKIQVAGINTFRNTQDEMCGNHIDFIAEQVIDTPIPWQASDTNNGTSSQHKPWLTSVAYAVLNGVNNYTTSAQGSMKHGVNASSKGIIHLLPSALQNVIIERRDLLDNRYDSSKQLTYSTGWDWASMGKLWCPKEVDVYGTQVRSNLGYAQGYWNPENGLSAQYTIFAHQAQSRVKKNSSGGRCIWWLSSTVSPDSTDVCYVRGNGNAGSHLAAHSTVCLPLCFRIG